MDDHLDTHVFETDTEVIVDIFHDGPGDYCDDNYEDCWKKRPLKSIFRFHSTTLL